MQKKILIVVGLIFLLFIALIFFLKKPSKDIHYHAGFQVYVDGKLQDFSGAKYMSIKLCGDEEKEHEEDEQLEKAHLHDGVGDVVHVEAEGAKWRDLFKNIKFSLDPAKHVEGFVNGKKVGNILGYSIKSYDSIVIFLGKSDINLLKNAVTKDKIIEIEKKSENC